MLFMLTQCLWFIGELMKITTPEISWHGRDPIYGVDFQTNRESDCRLATCGTDSKIRVSVVMLNAVSFFLDMAS